MSENKKNKSVVVIGGGIMGLGTAFHLSERGYKVVKYQLWNFVVT